MLIRSFSFAHSRSSRIFLCFSLLCPIVVAYLKYSSSKFKNLFEIFRNETKLPFTYMFEGYAAYNSCPKTPVNL